MRWIAIFFAALLAAPSAIAQERSVVVEDAWVRVFEGTVTAYFHVINNSSEPDRLLQVSTPLADRAELLRTVLRNRKYTYPPLGPLEIKGFDDERLRPGGNHVRLTGVKHPLAVGESVPLTLRFARSGTIEVNARVSNQLLGNR